MVRSSGTAVVLVRILSGISCQLCEAKGFRRDALDTRLSHSLDEAPAQILVMAAEQATLKAGHPVAAIWMNVFNLAKTTGNLRPSVWKSGR